MEKANKETGIMNFIENNPSATLAGFGALRGLLAQPQANAQAQSQVLQTQYSPWLGGGPGNPMAVKQPDALGNAVSGAMAGHIQKKNDEYNKAVLDKIGEYSPYKKPAAVKDESVVSLDQAQAHENPSHPVLIGREQAEPQLNLGLDMFTEANEWTPYRQTKKQTSPIPYRR